MSLIKDLADREHEQWQSWMKYLFEKSTNNPDGSVTIPTSLSDRWKRQMNTAYPDLPDEEKQSDNIEAIKTLKVIWKWFFPLKLLITLLFILCIIFLYQYYYLSNITFYECLSKYFSL